MPAVLYRCETWFLVLKEEYWLRIFKKQDPRAPNKVRVIKSRRIRWASHVARMKEDRSAFKILTGKPTGRRYLRMPRCRCEYNIKKYLKEIGINTRNRNDSA